jgi:hypothetical protein
VGVCPRQGPAGRMPDEWLESTRNLYPTGVHPKGPPTQTCWSEALFSLWQVQDSNLRRCTPTDLQNDDSHRLTSDSAIGGENFRPISPRCVLATVRRLPLTGSKAAMSPAHRRSRAFQRSKVDAREPDPLRKGDYSARGERLWKSVLRW